MRHPLTTAFLAAALLQPCPGLPAQESPTYRAGLKSFTVPPPTPDLVEAGSDYRVMFEQLAPTANRLIAAFSQPADLQILRTSGGAALGTYALVEVPRRAEFSDISPEQFKQIAESMGTQFGATVVATLKDQQDEINRRLKALNAAPGDITLDKPVQLGTLFSKPDACAYGMLMSVSTGEKAKKMAMGLTLLRVQSRILFIYTYTEYKDESTVQWIRTTDEHWADTILQSNK